MKVFAAISSLILLAAARPQDATTTAGISQEVSVLAVLATALPTSLVHLALTNPASASSLLASEFSAGHTPGWFSDLPTDVQTYLVPEYSKALTSPTPATATPSTILTTPTSTTVVTPTSQTNTTPAPSTPTSSSSTPALTPSTTMTVSTVPGTQSQTTSTITQLSTGGASMPSAILGAGLAGVVGFMGMLAL